MKGPHLKPPVEPMPPAAQLESAGIQLEWNDRDLEGATWAIHPRDMAELRAALDGRSSLYGLWFTIAADPELEGAGPRLVWPDEWPEGWGEPGAT